MIAGQVPKLVNKQFNSPINLYSPQNVQETLDKQTKLLANGAVGIDFNQLSKPSNLQNSAVLKMLEEEETRKRNGKAGLKRIAWPPPPEDNEDYIESSPVQSKTRGVGEYASYQSSCPSSVASPQPPPLLSSNNLINASPLSPSLSTTSPCGTLRQPSSFQQQTTPKTWAPVTPPATSPLPPLNWGHHQPSHQKLENNQIPNPNYQPPRVVFEPPPSYITLRSEAPISQSPPPIYQAQPAATLAPTSGNMRGDTKWPPESVKQQTEAENRARVDLAKGPAFRPRRVAKDYTSFFAQHALNSNYPGYRAPPGTQYFTPAYQQ
ncbi:hypothetical protein HCN44_004264 [Aphidius gifuensis]|uniref:Zasp-like motif domain-containing protein n=1 Tax=Aphidius gifuensis TaxID=684658 RepID=A0A834Y074_APHGI|nr:hypothetical protein HCN44_004264 [Aphidius gifuensis]